MYVNYLYNFFCKDYIDSIDRWSELGNQGFKSKRLVSRIFILSRIVLWSYFQLKIYCFGSHSLTEVKGQAEAESDK